jgi:hypothetical protein
MTHKGINRVIPWHSLIRNGSLKRFKELQQMIKKHSMPAIMAQVQAIKRERFLSRSEGKYINSKQQGMPAGLFIQIWLNTCQEAGNQC